MSGDTSFGDLPPS